MKVPAKKSGSKINTVNDDDTPVAVEEVAAADEVTIEVDGAQEPVEMCHFALTRDIDPSPTVGKISMTRDFGIPVLKKGVVRIPKIVAEVLHDKGYGEPVRL
jgi:hypothetical protein